AGSLGLLWAGRCARAGLDCRLLLRTPEALRQWQAGGETLLLEQGADTTALQVTAELPTSSAAPIRRLIVSTKAWAVAGALETLAHRLQPDSQLILLQNGLGSQQAVSQRFPDQRVLYASVTDGAWKRAANHVVWAGIGQTLLGDPQRGNAPAWLVALTQAGIDWQWTSNILPVLWVTRAINCASNPSCARRDCTNGVGAGRVGVQSPALLAELQLLLESQGVGKKQTTWTGELIVAIKAKHNISYSRI